MAAQVSKTEFKAKALEYFRVVQATGEPLIVTDHGKPALEIRRIASEARDPFAVLRGSVKRYDDPLEPVGGGDWDASRAHAW